jgi:murein L,D-transpeptidase YafK
MAFWRMLEQGYDHFEVTRQEPKVDVCETPGKFSPAEKTGLDYRGQHIRPPGRCVR